MIFLKEIYLKLNSRSIYRKLYNMNIFSQFTKFLNKIFVSLRRARLKLIGYKYIVNNNTKEIHVVSNMKTNCHLDLMTNFKYVKSSKELLDNGFNGCRWCYNETDTDKLT